LVGYSKVRYAGKAFYNSMSNVKFGPAVTNSGMHPFTKERKKKKKYTVLRSAEGLSEPAQRTITFFVRVRERRRSLLGGGEK
jgi:hypothetical protein